MKVIFKCDGSNLSGCKFEQKSHTLDLQKSTTNQIRLLEMVVWPCDNQKCEDLSQVCFDCLEKQS